ATGCPPPPTPRCTSRATASSCRWSARSPPRSWSRCSPAPALQRPPERRESRRRFQNRRGGLSTSAEGISSQGRSMDTASSDYDAPRYKRAGRGKIYDSILDTIGDTPLIRLPRLSAELKPKGKVLAKLEFFNPIASVKDRIGVSMVEAMEARG